MTLSELNDAPLEVVKPALLRCCGSTFWAKNVFYSRPFESKSDLISKSDHSWSLCTEADALEAFRHHPKIGSIESLEKKFASTASWAENEQQSVKEANRETLVKLSKGNQEYEDKFGYIFIVFATGKTAGEMLEILELRLKNSPEDEILIAMEEQNKITKLRLEKLIG